jgi:hypothetical protein
MSLAFEINEEFKDLFWDKIVSVLVANRNNLSQFSL